MLASPRRLLATVITATVLAVLLPATPAAAHNQLINTVPERDAVLQDPPAEVVLEFVERLDPKFTTIVVTDAGRQTVATSSPEISGSRGVVRFPEPLAPGTYTVAYRVVSLDGHPVQGSFRFTVGGDTPAVAASDEPAETAAPDASATDNDTTSGVSGTTIAVSVGLAAVVLALVVGVLLRRRSRSEQR
ncbi:MAG: copper resistance protein CopC [Actinobacteria bacterium]|nr:MAG: copper resistance protein CopC [Actinomycetota bacterium]